MWVHSLDWEDSLEKETATHSSILENPMDREARRAKVHGVAKSWAQLSMHSLTYIQSRSIQY